MDTHLGVIPYHPVENADNNTFLLPTMCPWRLANGCDDLITAELKRGMTRQKITDILAWEAVCGTTRREIHLNVYLSSGPFPIHFLANCPVVDWSICCPLWTAAPEFNIII